MATNNERVRFRENADGAHRISRAVDPPDLRAYVRGRVLKRWGGVQIEVLERVEVENARNDRQDVLPKSLVERE
jgi:hypothetical protein